MGTAALIALLILAAMVLFLLEILTPSFGLLAVMGIASLVMAAWKAFSINPVVGWVLTLVMIVLIPIYLFLLVKWLPNTPLGKRIFLHKADSAEGEGTPQAQEYESLVGKSGVTETPLHPSGAVRIDGKRVIALAESGMIEKGCSVTVIKAAGTNVIVRKTDD